MPFFKLKNLLLSTIVLHALCFAGLGEKRDGTLDTEALKKIYEESEFSQVRVAIETNMRKHKNPSREDKIFAFKYLGVIYASDSLTRTMAESYFNRLLDLSPNIELLDMFASAKIQEIFNQVKREYQARKQYKSKYDGYGNLIASDDEALKAKGSAMPPLAFSSKDNPDSNASKTRQGPKRDAGSVKKRNMVWPWVLGAAAVGAGVGVYLVTQEPESKPNRQF